MHKPAFTLIELLVVVVILTVLASLSLAGLTGARQRAKIDKTKSTIRKIDAVIRPMYDSYRTRRVDTASISTPTSAQCPRCYSGGVLQSQQGAAWKRLVALRNLLAVEMPDCWEDVPTNLTALPSYARTGPVRSYSGASSSARRSTNGLSESIYLVLARSGFEPDALEAFRTDEVGDTDADGASEFIDGWGKPIAFLRWAPGFLSPASPIQVADSDVAHDPLDPLRVDYNPPNRAATGYALIPLIVSGGPDAETGLTVVANGWLAANGFPSSIILNDAAGVLYGAPLSSNPTAYRDNITNHDLSKK